MGEDKSLRMFQAVAERAVEADMRQPDQCQRQRQTMIERNADGGQSEWSNGRVRRVVCQRADTRSQQITGKTQIGSQNKECEKSPAAGDAFVESDRHNQQYEPFDAQ